MFFSKLHRPDGNLASIEMNELQRCVIFRAAYLCFFLCSYGVVSGILLLRLQLRELMVVDDADTKD